MMIGSVDWTSIPYLHYIAFIVSGYLLGSIPFGLIAGKVFSGVDVRDHGSGRTGMTNVLRTSGVKAAVLVLALDMLKAVSAILLAKYLTHNAGIETAAGLAALIGHNWPVFTGFRGGRGTASGWASLFVYNPISGLIATLVGIPAVAITRYVSLGSLLGASIGGLSLSLMAYFMVGVPDAYVWFGIIGSTIVVARHKDNIGRLVRGEERKLGQKA
jgi:glycerol-3-phosphate acyltransferase PlsY